MSKTKFEQDLQEYFPEIWKLHQLGKSESHVWELIDTIIDMWESSTTGIIQINYSRGHIEDIYKREKLLWGKSAKKPTTPRLDEAGE